MKQKSNVLVIGSGGREHTLAWKLAQDDLRHVYVAPGNPGTDTTGNITNCDLNTKDHKAIAEWCLDNSISLVAVGPEDPLANGLADYLNGCGIKCFGPSQKAAQLESSKAFAKAFMDKYHIPTARWKSFTDPEAAKAHILNAPYDALVVKASGLATGKGVIVGKNREEAANAVDSLKQDLPSACDTIVVEELLLGEEVSVLCFSDGTNISVMPPAQDHKRLLDGDQGPMTGGMGAYCPCPLVSEKDIEHIRVNVLQRAVDGMRKDGCPYVGVLYAGLILTRDGPQVLEFNCRFGDPETQVILPLLESDLYEIMLACVDAKLDGTNIHWTTSKHTVGIVLASGGYPSSYPKGKVITGFEKLSPPNYLVFHAGTAKKSGNVVTSGGRVLAVVAVADSLELASVQALKGAQVIQFEGSFYRKDIAHKALQKLLNTQK